MNSPTCEVVHVTKLASEIYPTDSCLVQLVDRVMIQRLWVQTSLMAIFDKIYFVLCNLRSDRNASDFLIVKTQISVAVHVNKV